MNVCRLAARLVQKFCRRTSGLLMPWSANLTLAAALPLRRALTGPVAVDVDLVLGIVYRDVRLHDTAFVDIPPFGLKSEVVDIWVS